MAQVNRPKYSPVRWEATDQKSPLPLVDLDGDNTWTPLIRCPSDFPIELFEVAISQLIHHPEYNSTLILRSETISEITEDFPSSIPKLKDHIPLKSIGRKLLPRRPGRDEPLEQHCTLYASPVDPSHEGDEDSSPLPTVLILTPIITEGSSLPYYHPAVSHLAFRYISNSEPPNLQIEVVPLPGTPTDINSRLYRTSLALLETLHRYGWGAMTHYKKRVMHDCIVPREPYQDLYLVMRERHKHLVDTWQEVTDPLKHVFEDIGIATYLMLLWKDMYGTDEKSDTASLSDEPWKKWPQPPTGFVDLGCGNGLLTHILTAEGYRGRGIDLRRRNSWDHYPTTTQACLHEEAFDPTFINPESPSKQQLTYFPPGVFVIANHADELTPWVPVLSTTCQASGFLSIPCCAWTFDSKFERSTTPSFPIDHQSTTDFVESLNLGGDGSNSSSYSAYRIWLSTLTQYCGWKVECENLRIPSTRNWALVGRRMIEDETAAHEGAQNIAREHVEEILRGVKERGIFKTRRPEGKAGDH
ncbi:DUF1613-domain-containing protein [Abortiporus biennis]|nr:DUF1613-domain-containing protein [Abortiporus biennis]